MPSVYAYLTTRVAALGARAVETAPVLRTVKGPAGIDGPGVDAN